MRGRPPKPTKLKVLAGNPGKRKLNDREPQPKAKRMPSPPAHLDKTAKAEWRRIAPKLFNLGLLTHEDRGALAAYCQLYSRWVEAEKQIQEQGMVVESPNGYLIQNAYVSIANNALKQMKAFLTEFGLSPSSRSRIKVPDSKPQDPYEDFRRRHVKKT